MTVVALLVLVMDKSADGVSVSVSVAVLLFGVGSVVPVAGVTVAVFVKDPVAVPETVPFNVKVTVPLAATSTVVLILPLPLACPQLDPAEAAQVHVALVSVAGRMSETVAPNAALGPALLTTMVYVVWVPGTEDVALLVLVIARSDVALIVSVSVSLLLAVFGSGIFAGGVTVTVLLKLPVASLRTVPFSLKVAVALGNKFTVVLMLPVPLAAPQLPPALAVQVQEILVSLVGIVSVTVAPVTVLGPLLRTVIV